VNSRPNGDERRELAERIAASSYFQRSARLRNLLFYLVDRSLASPGSEIHEQEIATNVFDRPADQVGGEDSLVRVHASQLRRRLAQYFAAEGAREKLVLEIPRGNYAPVFRPQVPARKVEPGRYLRRAVWLAPLLAALAGWLWLENRELRRRVVPNAQSQPALAQFWSQIFRPDQATDIVVADSNLGILQDLLGAPVGLTEYLGRAYDARIQALPSPKLRMQARELMQRQHTSLADALLLHRILQFGRDLPRTSVFFAREFHARHLRSDNVVLLGSKRSNPWSELLEERTNFRFGFDEAARGAFITNRSPRSGEQAVYRAQPGSGREHASYCVVACVPNLGQTGSVLLIAGTEMEGTEGGGEFVSSERWLAELRRLLGARDRFPAFEVLLRVTKVGGAAPEFELVAWRKHG